MPHEPTSDTITRAKNALTKNMSVHIPLGFVGVSLLALCGWIYTHVDAAEAGVARNCQTISNQELSIKRNEAAVQRISEKLENASLKQVRVETKIDQMAEDIKEIKQLVKSR